MLLIVLKLTNITFPNMTRYMLTSYIPYNQYIKSGLSKPPILLLVYYNSLFFFSSLSISIFQKQPCEIWNGRAIPDQSWSLEEPSSLYLLLFLSSWQQLSSAPALLGEQHLKHSTHTHTSYTNFYLITPRDYHWSPTNIYSAISSLESKVHI